MSETGYNNPQNFEEEVEGNNTKKVDIYENWTDDPMKIENVVQYAIAGKFDTYELARITQKLDTTINDLNQQLEVTNSDDIRGQIHDCTLAYQTIGDYMSKKKTTDHGDAQDLGETVH